MTLGEVPIKSGASWEDDGDLHWLCCIKRVRGFGYPMVLAISAAPSSLEHPLLDY